MKHNEKKNVMKKYKINKKYIDKNTARRSFYDFPRTCFNSNLSNFKFSVSFEKPS